MSDPPCEYKEGDKVIWGEKFKGTVLSCSTGEEAYDFTSHGWPRRMLQDGICQVQLDYSSVKLDPRINMQIGQTLYIPVPLLKKDIESVIKIKANNAMVREVYERKTGQTAKPGHGPANTIRNFIGIKVPKGSEGGYKKTRKRKSNKK
jgi:hypothetical protein